MGGLVGGWVGGWVDEIIDGYTVWIDKIIVGLYSHRQSSRDGYNFIFLPELLPQVIIHFSN